MIEAPATALERAYAHCELLLRENDKDRFLADLFIPAARRRHIHALHAFSLEIARIRELVSEPMPARFATSGGATPSKEMREEA